MAALDLLLHKRKGLRGQCAALCEAIKEECDRETVDTAGLRRLEAKLECLTVREGELKLLDEKMLEIVEEDFYKGDDYEKELMLMDGYSLLIKEAKWMVGEKKAKVGPSPIVSGKMSVKLPVLELPVFDGSVTEYTPFLQAFNETIGDNPTLSSLDKFKYLKTFVKGEAAKVLQPIVVSSDNYALALDTLKNNFGQKEIIIHAHLTALHNLKPVNDVNKVGQLKELVNALEMHVKSIQNLGVDSKEYNLLLFHTVSNLLPTDLILCYCQQEKPAEVDVLLSWLRKEVSYRGRCQLLVHRSDSANKEKAVKPVKSTATAASLYLGEEDEEEAGAWATSVAETTSQLVNSKKKEFKPFCVLCFEPGHWTDLCTVNRTWEEKKAILFKRGRCFKCASRDHRSRQCQNPRAKCNKCAGDHYTVLCPVTAEGEGNVLSMAIQVQPKASYNLLQTAHAIVKVKQEQRDVRLLLDGGSQCSFVKEELVKRLKLTSIETVKLKLNIFGGESSLKKCPVVMIPLQDRQGNPVCNVRALVVPTLSVQRLAYSSREVVRRCAEKKMELADQPIWPAARETDEIDMLVGVDFYWKIVEPVAQPVGDNLMAMRTRFGWVIQGMQPGLVTEPRMDEASVVFVGVSLQSDKLEYEHLWKFDTIGVAEDAKVDEVDPVEIEWAGEAYQVNLPWVTDRRYWLSSNLGVAQKRLHSLLCKLEKQPGMLDVYHEAMRAYLDNGHAEEIGECSGVEPGYYLPHRAVLQEGTTTDVRVVFNASAKTAQELSLNDCVSAGKDRHLDLLSVLVRFRRFPWALVADVKKAFLQIQVAKVDRPYLKFLWLNLKKSAVRPYEVREYCMIKVTFGVNASPYLLKCVLQSHLDKYVESQSAIINQCKEDMYVDDLVESVENRELICQTQEVLQDVFQTGGFQLRKWATNDEVARSQWRSGQIEIEEKSIIKVLGQMWDTITDEVWVPVPVKLIQQSNKETKREILKLMASIFDPLGVLSLLTIKSKMLFQKAWANGTDWDEPVNDQLQQEWNEWKVHAVGCEKIQIERWGGLNQEGDGELHGFCDASLQAFGVVLYWRSTDKGEKHQVKFQLAKYRVTPLKDDPKIPRLELIAAAMLARMVNYWKQETHIQPKRVYLWSDSEIVLYWIARTDKLREAYVQKRLTEIRSLTEITEWRHCPGEKNPADRGTRKQNEVGEEEVRNWLKGPKWLMDESKWPPNRVFTVQEEEVMEEGVYQVSVEAVYWIDVKKYSSWTRLLRVTAWCLRFIRRCRRISDGHQTEPQLSWQELKWAARRWVKCVQKKHFRLEIEAVQTQKQVSKTSSLRKFQLILDSEGVLRIRSRLYESMNKREIASPVVIPGNDEVVSLYLHFRHEILLHEGCNALLADSRRHFWITKGRQACKRVVSHCRVCVKSSGPHFEPKTGPLPIERVLPSSAFINVGMDFGGPIYVKGQGLDKTYLLIITCLYSRAVHIELVSDLTAERFMLAFQRFLSRRGQPQVIYSDNAMTYKKAAKIMKQILATNVSLPKYSFFKLDPLSWKFIPERAPRMGGIWERVVRSVKTILRKVLGKASLTFEELSTVLTVVESVLNSRPLTTITNDVNEEVALTPNHLIMARSLCSLPLYDLGANVPELSLMKRYKYLQTLLQSFNRRWFRKYLLQLRNNHQISQGSMFLPSVGDVVLVELDNVKRHLYPMGRIVALRYGRDNVARSAQLRMSDGKILTRPVKRLYPLEPYSHPGGVLRHRSRGSVES